MYWFPTHLAPQFAAFAGIQFSALSLSHGQDMGGKVPKGAVDCKDVSLTVAQVISHNCGHSQERPF